MQPYSVDFFRCEVDTTASDLGPLTFVHHDIVSNITIDDDYISAKNNFIEIQPTDNVKANDYIYLQNEEVTFFGYVTDVSPGENITKITYMPFISIFDEDILFNVKWQGTPGKKTLENALMYYINQYYGSSAEFYQRLPIEVSVSSSTPNWSFNYEPEVEEGSYVVVKLYSGLIVEALKKYGVAINVTPNFRRGKIILNISTIDHTLLVDGDLNNVTVKTLKYNDAPSSTNKLTIYDANDYSRSQNFYVYTDNTWGVDNKNRIVPVKREVRSVTPESLSQEELDDIAAHPEKEEDYIIEKFSIAAVDAAYGVLSGLEWDNLIELEVLPRDALVNPTDLYIGQKVSLWYKGGKYTSILTGRTIDTNCMTLVFGSERIQYTKRFKKNGGK